MIANAVRYFDEDSAQRYDARHLEQVSAMCKRCVMVLIGQKSDTTQAGAEIMDGSEVTAGSAVSPGLAGTLITVRLSLAISGIDYRLGNFESAAFWAEQAFTELGGWNGLELLAPELSADRSALVKDWAEALKCAARAYAKLGEYDTACEYYEQELELLPEDMESELAVALNDYGVLLEEMGRFEESMDSLTKAWEIQKELFGPDAMPFVSLWSITKKGILKQLLCTLISESCSCTVVGVLRVMRKKMLLIRWKAANLRKPMNLLPLMLPRELTHLWKPGLRSRAII